MRLAQRAQQLAGRSSAWIDQFLIRERLDLDVMIDADRMRGQPPMLIIDTSRVGCIKDDRQRA